MVDYIVVGAGSAGCTVAARLSEDPDVRVLLLEAGGADRDLRVRTPGMAATLWRNRFDWGYRTTPQPALDGRRVYWPRGKVVGGCSAINYMIYMRGHRDNYDAWEREGNPGWGYDAVLPYFRKSECNERGADAFHGADGPLCVESIEANAMTRKLSEAASSVCGVPLTDDFNGGEQAGAGQFQVTCKARRRHSAATAFLLPALQRPNLTVTRDALVLGLVFEGNRAVGVRIAEGRSERVVRAERELLLCAGAIGSPHLLMLSGVGPADALRSHGVDVVHDLPGVGQNLQDHLFAPVSYEDVSGTVGNITPLNQLRWVMQYLFTSRGPMASNVAEGGAFVNTPGSEGPPNLQYLFLPAGPPNPNLDDTNYAPTGRAFSMLPTLLYPHSRGEIRLASTDPRVHPLIEPRYLSDDRDVRVLLEGVRMAQYIAHTSPVNECRGAALMPSAEAQDEATLRADIRLRASTLFHPVGTCKMGTDERAVVDARLRVHGLQGLRVVDASVMPTIVGGNTHAPTVMIGEKVADLIREGA